MVSLDELRQEIEAGTIDTIVTAFTDMQGRLFGKRSGSRAISGVQNLFSYAEFVLKALALLLRSAAVMPAAELSARTFCTFPREFSSFRRQGRPRENDADPRHGSARLLGRPRDPLLRGRRLQTRGPAGPGGPKAVSTPWSRGRVD